MKTKAVCVRVPLDVVASVDAIAEATGSTRTTVLVDMLRTAIVKAEKKNMQADDVVTVVASVVALYQEQKTPRR